MDHAFLHGHLVLVLVGSYKDSEGSAAHWPLPRPMKRSSQDYYV